MKYAMAATLVVFATTAGCASARERQESADAQAYAWQQAHGNHTTLAEEHAAVRRPPATWPKTTYDLAAAAAEPKAWADGETTCHALERWRARAAEMPAAEKARAQLLYEDATEHTYAPDKQRVYSNLLIKAKADKDLDLIVLFRQGFLEQALEWRASWAERWQDKPDWIEAYSKLTPEEVKDRLAATACTEQMLGTHHDPSPALVARVQVADERLRCEADPVCDAKLAREGIEEIRASICGRYDAMAEAKADAQEEWKTARQVGVVNVRALRDARTEYDLADEDLAGEIQSWERLTHKKWSRKQQCRPLARR